PRPPLDPLRRSDRCPQRRTRHRLRRGRHQRLYEGRRAGADRQPRPRSGQGHSLHLRPHPRLHHHQRRLSQLNYIDSRRPSPLTPPGEGLGLGGCLRKPEDTMSTSLPDIEAIERAGLQVWPGIEEKWDGSWVRRAAGGYTKRANSVQCLDPDDFEDADLRVISACTWMIIRQVKPVFRITPLAPYELNATLDESGWQTIGESHVYAMALGDHEADPHAEFLPLSDPKFLGAQQKLQGY